MEIKIVHRSWNIVFLLAKIFDQKLFFNVSNYNEYGSNKLYIHL